MYVKEKEKPLEDILGGIMKINYIEYSIKTKSLDIFFSGCNPPYCKDCCNPELWDFNNGTYWNDPIIFLKMEEYFLKYNNLIDNVFLVGGSPNHQDTKEMSAFLNGLQVAMGDVYNKPIWLFAKEELDDIHPIFKIYCSYIKCGEYIPELKCEDNIQYSVKLATKNQNIYKKGIDYD